MSIALTEAQVDYIRWLAKEVGSPIPVPECISEEEASWLIRDMRLRLARKRAHSSANEKKLWRRI